MQAHHHAQLCCICQHSLTTCPADSWYLEHESGLVAVAKDFMAKGLICEHHVELINVGSEDAEAICPPYVENTNNRIRPYKLNLVNTANVTGTQIFPQRQRDPEVWVIGPNLVNLLVNQTHKCTLLFTSLHDLMGDKYAALEVRDALQYF